MSRKIDKLLAVLDMPEEEQWGGWRWLFDHSYLPMRVCFGDTDEMRMARADLAFRLRDEAMALHTVFGEDYNTVVKALSNYICNPPPNAHLGKNFEDYLVKTEASSVWVDDHSHWWNCKARPIHVIIAALITKDLANESS